MSSGPGRTSEETSHLTPRVGTGARCVRSVQSVAECMSYKRLDAGCVGGQTGPVFRHSGFIAYSTIS